MNSKSMTNLRNALKAVTEEIAQCLNVPLALKLWDGSLFPLSMQDAKHCTLHITIDDPSAIPSLLRRPTLDRIIRLYAHGKIGFEGGTLIDFGKTLSDKGTRRRLKNIPKLKLIWLLLPFIFLPGVSVATSRQFDGDEVGDKKNRRNESEYIGFHYDVSNDFYKLFLDESMVYTCAYFTDFSNDLEKAQFDKLEMTCRKLRLKSGEKFLDIGCGWGALICHAAKHHKVSAHGVTLSKEQYDFATARIKNENLQDSVTIELIDYRDVTGSFDKISSIGMYEAIGVAAIPEYMTKVRSLLAPDGLFLNHGITRRAKRKKRRFAARAEQRALVRYIFPGGELDDIGHTLQELEFAGFDVHDVEGWRDHYALTTQIWCERLTARQEAAIAIVGEQTYRIWVAYLAGCSLAFTRGSARLYQTLAGRSPKGPSNVPPSRADLYR